MHSPFRCKHGENGGLVGGQAGERAADLGPRALALVGSPALQDGIVRLVEWRLEATPRRKAGNAPLHTRVREANGGLASPTLYPVVAVVELAVWARVITDAQAGSAIRPLCVRGRECKQGRARKRRRTGRHGSGRSLRGKLKEREGARGCGTAEGVCDCESARLGRQSDECQSE